MIRLISILLIITTEAYSQTDSLAGYSYQIIGLSTAKKTVIPIGGSGFFLRKGGRLFFITANHVVSSCDSSFTFPASMNIIVRNTGNGTFTLRSVLMKKAMNVIPCDSLYHLPDFNLFEIDEYNNKHILSVEKFIQPLFNEVSNIEIYGFPSHSAVSGNILIPKSRLSFNIDNNLVSVPMQNGIPQDFNYLIKIENISDSLNGFSGSPIFIKNKTSNQKRLMGLLSASVREDSITYLVVCRIEIIVDRINSIDCNRIK